MKHQKQKAYAFGQWGEDIACLMLRLKGYCIVARNQRTVGGEIDIIAKRRHILCFIEVKSRPDLNDALHALSFHQQKRLISAAQAFLSANPRYVEYDLRFDLVAVSQKGLPRHVKNAWFEEK